MTTESFAYWLQGFFEISDAKALNEKQVTIIKDHLAEVFNKVTPDRNNHKENSSSSQEVTGISKKRHMGGTGFPGSGSGVLLC